MAGELEIVNEVTFGRSDLVEQIDSLLMNLKENGTYVTLSGVKIETFENGTERCQIAVISESDLRELVIKYVEGQL